ncbi:hypothetical protein BDC45DRAFT_559564 [Circinella umbellata]|nr:hypothetical protein BDC45DRAFT_559564 [Circinella umbellata]
MHILKIARSLSLGPLLVTDCDITQLETLLNQKYSQHIILVYQEVIIMRIVYLNPLYLNKYIIYMYNTVIFNLAYNFNKVYNWVLWLHRRPDGSFHTISRMTPELSESLNSYIQRMTIWYTRSLIGYAALRDKAASASSLTVCRLHLESVVDTCEIDRTATTLLSNPCSNLLDLSDRISVGLVSFCDYHLGLSKDELGYLKNQVTTWLHIFIRMTLSLAYARNLVNEYDNDYSD